MTEIVYNCYEVEYTKGNPEEDLWQITYIVAEDIGAAITLFAANPEYDISFIQGIKRQGSIPRSQIGA